MPRQYDVVIIGGGPAGATAACALAQRGRSVLVLEKDAFPRYHIGESMIPYCYFPLERIGFIDKLKKSRFPRKYSVQFVSMSGRVSSPFYFFKHLDHEASTSWQVVRSEFDQMLLDHARESGATVEQGTRVRDFLFDDDRVVGVVAESASNQLESISAPYVIDASGRNAFAIKKFGWRVKDPQLQKVVIWTYYEGAKRDEGIDEAATTVAYLPDKGWFWYIPLSDNKVSVGVVAEKDYLYDESRDPETVFEREVEKNAWIKDHLAPGHRSSPFAVTADFSYRAKHSSRPGLVLTGDAFSFLDPVFSSGLFLAFWGAEKAAMAIDQALDDRSRENDALEGYTRELRNGLEAMRKLVYAFYEQDFSFGDLIKAHPDVEGDLTDCLIGHVEKDFGALFNAVKTFVEVPDELSYGWPRDSRLNAPST